MAQEITVEDAAFPDPLSSAMSETAQWYARRTGIAFGFFSTDTVQLVGNVRLAVGCERCGFIAAATVVPQNSPHTQQLKRSAMQIAADEMASEASARGCEHWADYVQLRELMGR